MLFIIKCERDIEDVSCIIKPKMREFRESGILKRSSWIHGWMTCGKTVVEYKIEILPYVYRIQLQMI